MRRTIYGLGITLLYCVGYIITIGLNFGVVWVFMMGASMALLWDIGVISNIKYMEKEFAKDKLEVGK